jgi:hypothetical protein
VSGGTFPVGNRAQTQLPSRAQLLVLVAAVEGRELTPSEPRLLGQGVKRLMARLDALRNERDTAVRARDEALRQAGSPLMVSCGYCKAPVGRRCVSKSDGTVVLTPHTARLHALSRRLEVAS